MATPQEDALRRDFTINGMFYDPLEEEIHDFVHGQEDIRKGIIRAIGDPHERFFEDRLRMLRAFRFAARFSFSIDPSTQEAIRENADKLFPAVAMERVWQEFNKMAAYPRFDHALVEMHRLTLLDVIFPEVAGMHIKDMRRSVKYFPHFPPNTPHILYIMECLTTLPSLQRLAIAKRLKVSNKDFKLLEYMNKLDETVAKELQQGMADLQHWTSFFANPDWEICMHILAGRYADEKREEFFKTYADRYRKLEAHVERQRNGNPLISASVLQKHGIPPGKRMGGLLKEAEKIAINEDWNEPEPVLAKLSNHPLWQESGEN